MSDLALQVERLRPQLRRHSREATVLVEDDEADIDEIWRELTITSDNLFVLLHRARLRLRDCLQARWFDTATVE